MGRRRLQTAMQYVVNAALSLKCNFNGMATWKAQLEFGPFSFSQDEENGDAENELDEEEDDVGEEEDEEDDGEGRLGGWLL